ncbi:MAG: hypothetical protein RIA63_14980 [Cyclobacteriaceae bacterium]
MKYMKLFILSTMLVAGAWSCSPKTESVEEGDESTAVEWKGMDEFHMIMAESFHPYRDSANLAPARQYAREMVSLAEAWSENELPEKVNNDEVKGQLAQLKEATEALADLVEVGDDEAIGTSLTNVHDVFHHLQEAWYKK